MMSDEAARNADRVPTATDRPGDALAALPLPAKVRLLTGASSFGLHAEPRLGLRAMTFSDGPTGVRGDRFAGGAVVSLLPNATLLAQTWDESALSRAGDILGQEAVRQQVHTVLGPTINLHRSVLGGRLFEAYSEDPLLSGKLAAAYVRGLQAHRVAACPKHLVANESETERAGMDSRVAEDVLRELYLLPFEIAWTEGGCWTLMAAYNRVNGVAATENRWLLHDLLRREWGFDGLVMSDWYATAGTEAPAAAGLDLVMPGPRGPWGERLVAAVAKGRVAAADVDEKVRRLLRLAERTGAWGPERTWDPMPAPDDPRRCAELTDLAARGMVVLRNERSTLPLAPGARLAVIGRHGVDTTCSGGGSARVNPPHRVSIAEGLVAAGFDCTVVDGVEVRHRPVPAAGTLTSKGQPGIRVQLLGRDERSVSDELVAEAEFEFEPGEATGAVLSGTLAAGGPQNLGVIGTGSWRVRLESGGAGLESGGTGAAGAEEWRFILRATGDDPGETMIRPPSWTVCRDLPAGARLIARFNPLGELPDHDGPPDIGAIAAAGAGVKALVAAPEPAPVDAVLARAAAAAEAADIAVVVVGTTDETETEAADKETLALIGEQDRMVRAVAAAARRTVVVVNAATPVLMPWADEVDAIVVAGLPGQEAGHAVAAALSGRVEPAGRLVTSWPAADGAAPAWSVTPTKGSGERPGSTLAYAEGRFIGYRGHEPFGLAPAPAYWFGEGLGYGDWDYHEVTMLPGAGAPRVRIGVRNRGERTSREVIQVYFRPGEPGEPIRLVGWAGVTAGPGESAEAVVTCEPRMWRRWDAAAGRWGRLHGTGELIVARGLGDIRMRLGAPGPMPDDGR